MRADLRVGETMSAAAAGAFALGVLGDFFTAAASSALEEGFLARVDLRGVGASLFRNVPARKTSWTIMPTSKTPMAMHAATILGSVMSRLMGMSGEFARTDVDGR